MQFVEDHCPCRAEQPRYLQSSTNEEGFERFRRDQQHAFGPLDSAGLDRRWYIAVPRGDWHFGLTADIFEAAGLICDERLQRCDVENIETGYFARIVENLGKQRK